MQEIYKDYKGLFDVSNFGNVKRKNGTIIKQRLSRKKNGYLVFQFKDKTYTTHRLVGTLFLGEPKNNNYVINHKDFNTLNNNVENLEWVTKAFNQRYRKATLDFYVSEEAKLNFIRCLHKKFDKT